MECQVFSCKVSCYFPRMACDQESKIASFDVQLVLSSISCYLSVPLCVCTSGQEAADVPSLESILRQV